jgi:hypothetical protein
VERAPDEVVTLARGSHALERADDEVTLRWGDHLPRPDRAAPTGTLLGNLSRRAWKPER